MSNILKWLFTGPIAGFLPTLLGTFLGFVLGSIRNERSDRRVFHSMVNFAFVELNDRMRYMEAHSNLIKSGDHLKLTARPKDFINANIISFPAALDSFIGNSHLARFANTILWANLFNRITGARLLWGQLSNSDYPAFNDLLVSYENLAAMYMEIGWCLYCIARNEQNKFDPTSYGKLIAIIQANMDRPLHLERIFLKKRNFFEDGMHRITEVLMTRKRKILTKVIILALVCGVFATGVFIGFNHGYSYRVFQASVGDSYSTFRVLEMINSGDINGAKKHLEMELDTQIVEHWSGLVSKPLNLSMLPQNETATTQLMSRVAAYRKTKPTIIDDAKVNKAIETVINRYQR